MFYNKFETLCLDRGIRPGRAASDMGISRAAVTRWKQEGFTPRSDSLEKISRYFDVSIDSLLDMDPDADKLNELAGADENGDFSVGELLEMLKNRRECRILFSLARNATPADVERAVKIIEALRAVKD